MHWVQLGLPICTAIYLSIVNLVGTTPLKKIDSPSPSSYQWPVVSQLGVGFVPTSASHLQPGIWSGLSLKKSCGFCHNICNFICATAQICPENSVSCRHLLSLVLTAFLPFFHNNQQSLSLVRWVWDSDVPFRVEHSTVFYSLYLDYLQVSVLITI